MLSGVADEPAAQDAPGWAATTRGASSDHVLPGKHFFLVEPSADAVLGIIASDLSNFTA